MKHSIGNSSNIGVKYVFRFIIIVIAVILITNLILLNSSIFYRKSLTLPFSMHLNKQEVTLKKGEEFKLSVFGINLRVSYYSTNFRVVGVNFNGRIYAYHTGKAFIIAKVRGKELKCLVRVIDLNKEHLTLHRGRTYDLDIEGASDLQNWKSSNPKVASVSCFGKVKAKKKGTATITVKVKGKILKCVVLVK